VAALGFLNFHFDENNIEKKIMGSWLRFLLVEFWQNFAKTKTLHLCSALCKRQNPT
jgi:hypothetical protein